VTGGKEILSFGAYLQPLPPPVTVFPTPPPKPLGLPPWGKKDFPPFNPRFHRNCPPHCLIVCGGISSEKSKVMHIFIPPLVNNVPPTRKVAQGGDCFNPFQCISIQEGYPPKCNHIRPGGAILSSNQLYSGKHCSKKLGSALKLSNTPSPAKQRWKTNQERTNSKHLKQ
jgi:hypothetical protein